MTSKNIKHKPKPITDGYLNHIVRLWLDETPNEYILEKIVILKEEPIEDKYSVDKVVFGAERYIDGYIVIREKYSPLKLTVSFSQLIKWVHWRNGPFLYIRYIFMQEKNISPREWSCLKPTNQNTMKWYKKVANMILNKRKRKKS